MQHLLYCMDIIIHTENMLNMLSQMYPTSFLWWVFQGNAASDVWHRYLLLCLFPVGHCNFNLMEILAVTLAFQ